MSCIRTATSWQSMIVLPWMVRLLHAPIELAVKNAFEPTEVLSRMLK